MKTLILLAILIAATISSIASTNLEADSTKMEKKIVTKIISTDEGETIIDSTFIYEGDEVEVLVQKTKGGKTHKAMLKKLQGHHGDPMIWHHQNDESFDIDIETLGDSTRVIVMRKPEKEMKEFFFDVKDGQDIKVMKFHGEDFEVAPTPMAPHSLRRFHTKDSRLIDLNDPRIVSFEREELRNGDEKITIIRKKSEE